ncbi:hypothetical protein AVEN_209289-1 [Araneus ventricosus]|uniref:Uncharacterized protein n=1 Tax=Araneus ventricosus TaxID=182803 RepID=A0A4Y2CB77_ARAVE|nr:hypothetical protein AVEN_209289-1 [Araneus ventricosus]
MLLKFGCMIENRQIPGTRLSFSLSTSNPQVIEASNSRTYVGYGGFKEWLPRSPDLTPMDFFLWRIPQTAGVYDPSANIA